MKNRGFSLSIAKIPVNEAARLEDLGRLAVLDTPPDSLYGDLTRIAAKAIGAPIAAITLVDRKRVWFKDVRGIDIIEVPRDASFCSHAILQDDMLVVEDMHLDPRFHANPYVTGAPQIRFYAGVPLVTARGFKVGTFCVMDFAARLLAPQDAETLRALARQVATHFERSVVDSELRLAASRIGTLINESSMGILSEDENGRIAAVNHGYCRIFGLKNGPASMLGRTGGPAAEEFKSLFVRPTEIERRVAQILACREVVVGEELRTVDGRTLERDYLPIFVGTVYKGHLWVLRDVTEKKDAERIIESQKVQIAATAKLSALGEMAGGIAHEINNPLAIIQGRSQHLRSLAKRDRLDKEAVLVAANAIDTTTERLAKIVHGLRSFAKDGDLDPCESLQVARLFGDTLAFCAERFRNSDVRLDVDTGPAGLALWCRPVPLSQVLLNLLNNAFDAASELTERWVRLEVRDAGDTVTIAVTDSGGGIPRAVRDAMMRPFFTTKGVGKGTGLGLSVSKGIVESHGGSLELDETCTHTRFVVTLPKLAKGAP